MKKLIIIEHEQLTPRTKSIWMFDALTENSVDFEYWDISHLCDRSITLIDELEDTHVTKIQSYAHFVSKIIETDRVNAIFVDEFPFIWGNVFKRIIMRFCGCTVIRFDMYANIRMPSKEHKVSLFEKISNPKQLLYNVFARMSRLHHYKDVFSTSAYVGRTKALNHPDYEKFIDAHLDISKSNIIVFADEYFPEHPDYHILLGYTPSPIDIRQYQRDMCALFDYLEKKTGKEVIIAAHPKSNYSGTEFGDRKIIKGKTMELIAESCFVILHQSSSMSYALLADKPFIITYTDLYKSVRGELFDYLYKLSSYLEQPLYRISDKDLCNIKIEKIPEATREKYIYNLLTSKETSNITNLQILLNYLS